MNSSSLGAQLNAHSYTDLNRLSALKVGETDSDENVRKVAQEFESLFVSQMLSSMRAASDALADENNPFNSPAARQYRDMHDQQLAVSLSTEGRGIGLADVLARQIGQQAAGSARPSPFAGNAAAEAVSTEAPLAAATEVSAAAADAGDGVRNDAALLAARRLTMPSRINPQYYGAPESASQQTASPALVGDGKSSLASRLWTPAVTHAAPEAVPLEINGLSSGSDASTAVMKTRFDSPDEFIATMMPMAEAAAERLGVDASYLVAQAALETGWGRHMIKQGDGSASHNLFGIKATAWTGPSAQVRTTEYIDGEATSIVDGFRVYASYENSFNDYVGLLENSSRYSKALEIASSGDSGGFMAELQQAGYATDPEYARKISQIARRVEAYQVMADNQPDASSALRTRG